MKYITNKYNSIKLPNDPGMIEWLHKNYPHSGYIVVDIKEYK